MKNILSLDAQYVWHPYQQPEDNKRMKAIVSGQGSWLKDENEKRYLDLISSWWVNVHGHAHPKIAAAVHEQFLKLDHVIFGGFTHEPAVKLAQRLVDLFPGQMSKAFFSDNGSTAVEVAIKMAIQFRQLTKRKGNRIVAFENSYHGDTFGTMSISSRGLFTDPFRSYLFDTTHCPAPYPGKEDESLNAFRQLLEKGDVAVFIYEPLVQGAGGMMMMRPEALNAMIALCRQYDVTVIADEVMTGFFRTGTFFASMQMSQHPDIGCLSKGITGGVMPLGLTICNALIASAFGQSADGVFYHGHSYTANPLACAAANASLDVFASEHNEHVIQNIVRIMGSWKEALQAFPDVKEVRHCGAIVAIEFKESKGHHYLSSYRSRILDFFIPQGFLVRPLGNVLYFMPPYCITESELDETLSITKEFMVSLLD